VNPLEIQLDLGQSSRKVTDVELAKGRMIELLEPTSRGTDGLVSPLGKRVVSVEAVFIQDLECGVASRAAELVCGARIE
jgi:hypothetical protein